MIMNLKRLNFTLILLIASISLKGQINPLDSIEFLGNRFKVPIGCKTIYGGQVLCDSYAVTWSYEPASDMERHMKEGIAQLKNPKKFDCYIVGTKMTAYKSKFDPGVQVAVFGVIKGQGVLLWLWFDKDIKSNADIPQFVSQFFQLPNGPN
jgi:hypothetical protein